MLAKHARLRASEVKEVLIRGTSVRVKGAPYLSVKFIREEGPFRAAVVVPKSISRGAVVRNRVRRAVYRALKSLSNSPRAVRAVFFVQKLPQDPIAQFLRTNIESLIQKIT